MSEFKQLHVFFEERKVGTLVPYKNSLTAFEYDRGWLSDGFPLNPFSLPLEQKVFLAKMIPFDGLYGVFADSLPDGWGRLLVDRVMLSNHIDPGQISTISRLAMIGKSGMGALTYKPEFTFTRKSPQIDFDNIAAECNRILKAEHSSQLDNLFLLGGSAGGTRPKILTTIDDEEWIIKFPSLDDNKNIGKQEYGYSLCVKECGILMEETRLFPSQKCDGYFGTKRFDRVINPDGERKRIHMVSVSALLETSHRIPNLDYNILMKLTLSLTKEFEEIEKLYRLMCFNVFAHNRDDHAKNFSFLYIEKERRWILSPAYDLTYSHSIGGEHAITVHGNGNNPGRQELLLVAKGIGFSARKAKEIADEIYECVQRRLFRYLI